VDDADRDTIRLSVPADDAMRSVVEVAIGVVARRCGFADDDVRAARVAGGDALADLSVDRGGPVTVEVRSARGGLTVRLANGADERTLTLP
jgi:hypothetical protein